MSLSGPRPVRSQRTKAERPLSRHCRAASIARASSAPPPTVPSKPAAVHKARVPAWRGAEPALRTMVTKATVSPRRSSSTTRASKVSSHRGAGMPPAISLMLFLLPHIAAPLDRADNFDPAAALFFLHQIGGVATRAGSGHGFVPQGKIALGVLVAGIEYLAAFGAFFHQLALAAARAGHARGKGRGVAAFGVARTGNEAAARAGAFDDQVASALGALPHFFVLRLLRGHGGHAAVLPPLKIAGIAAFRVAGTG